jgi:hypothetical protein
LYWEQVRFGSIEESPFIKLCEDFRNKPNQSGEGNTLTTFQGVDTADEAVAQLK